MDNSGWFFLLMMACFALVIGLAATALLKATGWPRAESIVMVGQGSKTMQARGNEEVEDEKNGGREAGKTREPPADGEEDEGDFLLVAVPGIPRSYGLRTIQPFMVRSRSEALEDFPCSDCHEDEPVNAKERELTEEHENKQLQHGGERFWCLTCHGSKNKDSLTSLKGRPIGFDESFILCGQCHFQRQRDWYFGAHGKRIGNWRGERRVMTCPECHDPHSPSIKPFKPSPPPLARKGLTRREPHAGRHQPVWVEAARATEAR